MVKVFWGLGLLWKRTGIRVGRSRKKPGEVLDTKGIDWGGARWVNTGYDRKKGRSQRKGVDTGSVPPPAVDAKIQWGGQSGSD